MSPDGLRAVTFDFWETLVRDTPEAIARGHDLRVTALARALERAGCPRPAAEVRAAYERGGAEVQRRYWDLHRDPLIRDQVRLVLECAEAGAWDRLTPDDREELVQGYVEPVLRRPPALMPGADVTVAALAARGFRLAIVSNTGRTPGMVLRRVLEGHGLLHHFRAVSYSDEVGERKPAPGIFARTLAALGVTPAEALHVGDNPDADVQGAHASGLRAAHYVVDGRPPSPEADLVLTHLADLPDRLEALGPRS